MNNFTEFLNTHTWAATLFVLFCAIAAMAFIVGLSLLFIHIETMMKERKYRKLRKNYPEFFKTYDKFHREQLEKWEYYKQNIQPIKEKIDTLIQDNYIQTEEKNKQLYVLREEYAEKYLVYESLVDKVTELRKTVNKIAKEIYVTDKSIKGIWGWNEDD